MLSINFASLILILIFFSSISSYQSLSDFDDNFHMQSLTHAWKIYIASVLSSFASTHKDTILLHSNVKPEI